MALFMIHGPLPILPASGLWAMHRRHMRRLLEGGSKCQMAITSMYGAPRLEDWDFEYVIFVSSAIIFTTVIIRYVVGLQATRLDRNQARAPEYESHGRRFNIAD